MFDLSTIPWWLIFAAGGAYVLWRNKKPQYDTYHVKTTRVNFEILSEYEIRFSDKDQVIHLLNPDETKIHPRFAFFAATNPWTKVNAGDQYYEEHELVPGKPLPYGGTPTPMTGVYLPVGLETRYKDKEMKIYTDMKQYTVVIWE